MRTPFLGYYRLTGLFLGQKGSRSCPLFSASCLKYSAILSFRFLFIQILISLLSFSVLWGHLPEGCWILKNKQDHSWYTLQKKPIQCCCSGRKAPHYTLKSALSAVLSERSATVKYGGDLPFGSRGMWVSRSWSQCGLHNEFQTSQSYVVGPCPSQEKENYENALSKHAPWCLTVNCISASAFQRSQSSCASGFYLKSLFCRDTSIALWNTDQVWTCSRCLTKLSFLPWSPTQHNWQLCTIISPFKTRNQILSLI